MINKKISLSATAKSPYINSVHAVQNENNSRNLEIEILDDNNAVDLSDCKAVFYVIQDDTTQQIEALIEDNIIKVTLNEKMMLEAGRKSCWIQLIKADGTELRVDNLTLLIQACPIDERIKASDEFSVLVQLIQSVEGIEASVGELEQDVREAVDEANQAIQKIDEKILDVESRTQQAINKVDTSVTESERKVNELITTSTQKVDAAVKKAEDKIVDIETRTQTAITDLTEATNQNIANNNQAVTQAIQQMQTATSQAVQEVDEAVQKANEAVINVDNKLQEVDTLIDGKVDKNQGAENKGKILGIGADGNVIPVDAPSGGAVEEKWELINEITLTESANSIKFTQDSAGEPLNLKEFCILLNAVSGDENLAQISSIVNDKYTNYLGNLPKSTTSMTSNNAYGKVFSVNRSIIGGIATPSAGVYIAQPIIGAKIIVLEENYSSIEIKHNIYGRTIKENSNFKLYGVRK